MVSVIIPVWNGQETIRLCLDAILNQSIRREDYEVILVDNASTDKTCEIAGAYPGINLIREDKPGSYIARNTGLKLAKGHYVAFTDADCIPSTDWLETGLRRLDTLAKPGIVAGSVNLFGGGTATALAYDQTFAFRQYINVPAGNCVTANWMSPRDLIDEFGGFDSTLFSGGDWKLSRAIKAAGYDVVYEPSMRISHPPRASVREIIQKRKRIAGGKVLGLNQNKSLPAILGGEAKDAMRKATTAWLSDQSISMKFRLSALSLWIGVISIREATQVRLGRSASRV